MVEVSERGAKEEEIELDLGLSIGRAGLKRSEKRKLDGGDTRENEYQTVTVVRSSSTVSPPMTLSEAESDVLDPQERREMQALRRQEATRKREEKKTRALIGEQQQPPAKKNGVLSQDNIAGNVEHHHYPVGPVQYPYAPVQFVPYSNGFAYPCVVPCWEPNGGGGGGFRQFQDLGNKGCNPEQNGKTASLNNGSPICSSSTVSSEHYSAASHEGGSSDAKSHSSRLSGSIGSDHTATSHSIESNHYLVIRPTKEEPAPEITEPVPIAKPISSNEECPPPPLKETKMEPPKPKTENIKNREKTPSMPQMPYVSTTGNGPNGKTVHGFLYRYSKSEISIVCVCHGSTFSPAEFVQHAGGADVTQPLRHITVIPSAFG